MTFTISANVLGATTLTLELENGENTTVLELKEMIEAKNPSSPKDVQMVVYAGKMLEDEKTLKHYNIKEGVKLFIGVSPNKVTKKPEPSSSSSSSEQQQEQKQPAEVKRDDVGFELVCFVVGKGKKTLNIPGGVEATVKELTELIEENYTDLPSDTQLLAVNGKKLEDGKTLGQCGVASGQTVYVGRKPSSKSSKPGALDEDTRGADTVIADLMAALGKIKSSIPFDDFVIAMKKVSVLLGNLIDHPDEPKYRRIRTANATLQKALFQHPGGVDAVKALGYRESTEEPGTLFVKEPSQHLPKVRKMLVDAFKQQGIPLPQSTQSSSSSSQAPNPFASPFGSPFSGLGQGLPNMSQDPMMQAMMSNPQLMESMMPQMQQMMSNPAMMQQMMQGMQNHPMVANNPMMQQMLQDPQAMERMSQAASMMAQNPGMMQQMMQSMNQFGGMGQGFGQQPQQQQQQQPQQQSQQPQQQPSQQQQQPNFAAFGNAMMQSEEAMIEEAIRRSLQDQGGNNNNNNNNNNNDDNNNNNSNDDQDVDQ